MSSGRKCKNCGSSDIEVDPARGDAVCTNCGSVLEDNIIVAEVQFEENAHGTSSAIGQFVSADSKGGASNFGASFHVGMGVESREMTLKKARTGISNLCNQLRLNQHCIDTACSFFKMALSRNLTRGRRNTHVHAACVYLTCRTEGTAHMLIDISDVLQICCYELGRTYLRLSQALCINVPSLDPCLYILRFAGKLEFGSKTQQVVNTALRLVQRMKRDSIHSGRRPSGLCGAALLMAARLHEFNRSTSDIVKIVKVHESTLRKRLIEFGDTPSSALTLEEFMTVDLEEEQDPPSFKAARKKDKERLQKLMEEEADNITELQKEIERQLDKASNTKTTRKCKRSQERDDADRFIKESTLDSIKQIIDESVDDPKEEPVAGLGPDIARMGLAKSLDDSTNAITTDQAPEVNLTFDDIKDEEIDMYIMSENESKVKNGLWHKHNAAYLEEQKIKEEKLKKEKEEGKPEKKKKRNVRKKQSIGPSNSAGEAIEKILQEKKISTKINYDVLKSLNAPTKAETVVSDANSAAESSSSSEVIAEKRPKTPTVFEVPAKRAKTASKSGKPKQMGLPIFSEPEPEPEPEKKTDEVEKEPAAERLSEDDLEEDYEEDGQNMEEAGGEMGVLEMLQQHREAEEDNDDYFGTGYEEDDY